MAMSWSVGAKGQIVGSPRARKNTNAMKQSPVQMRSEAIRKIKLQSRNQAIWQFEREDTRKDFDCSYHSLTSSNVIKNGNKKNLTRP